jgi:hypothetical protein
MDEEESYPALFSIRIDELSEPGFQEMKGF